MVRVSIYIIFLVFSFVAVKAQSLKSDDFSSNDLSGKWFIVNPNPDSKIQITDGHLNMYASIANGGSDLWATTNHNAPRILQKVIPCGNIKVETKLKINFSGAYQGAGILLVRGDTPDSEDEVRICHYLYRGYEYFSFISMAGMDFENPYSPGYNDLIRYSNDEIYFRLEIDSTNLYRWYSEDGENWILMDSIRNETPIKYIGLFTAAQKWGSIQAADVEASFEYWKVTLDNIKTDVSFTICQGDRVRVGDKYYFSTGQYIDTLTSSAGCDSIVSTTLNVLTPEIIEQNFSICPGDSVTVETDVYKNTGTYTFKIANEQGCDSIIYNTIIEVAEPLNVQLGNDTTLCDGEFLSIGTHLIAGNSLWNTGSTERFIEATAPGTYILIISDDCSSASDTIKLASIDCDCKVFIPNAFSPNGDGKNDVLIIKEENIISSGIIIYNKWGEEVFQPTTISSIGTELIETSNCLLMYMDIIIQVLA